MIRISVLLLMSGCAVWASACAAPPTVSVVQDRIADRSSSPGLVRHMPRAPRFLSIPVEGMDGGNAGQIDIVVAVDGQSTLLDFRPPRNALASDGTLTVKSLSGARADDVPISRRSQAAAANDPGEPTVVGYGSDVVYNDGTSCIVVAYARMSDGSRQTVDSYSLKKEESVDNTP